MSRGSLEASLSTRAAVAGRRSSRATRVSAVVGPGAKTIPVGDVFPDGATVIDAYSGTRAKVQQGRVTVSTPYTLVLLSR